MVTRNPPSSAGWEWEDGMITYTVFSQSPKRMLAEFDSLGYGFHSISREEVLKLISYRIPQEGVRVKIIKCGRLNEENDVLLKRGLEIGLIPVHPKIIMLTRLKFTDAQLHKMGLWAVISLTSITKGNEIARYFGIDEQCIRAFQIDPRDSWLSDDCFAFMENLS